MVAEQAPGAELDIIGTLWAYKVGLIGCLFFGAAVGFGLSQLQPVRYTAESRVFLSSSSAFDPLDQRSSAGNQERYVVQQAELMSSRPVLERVRLPTGAGVPQAGLRDLIEVTPSADSDLVVIAATAADPRAAAALADGVALAFQEFTADQVADAAERAVAAVNQPEQAAQIRAAAAVYGDGVSIVDRAEVPQRPSQPAPLRNTLVLAVLAGLVYAVVAVLPNLRWKTVVDVADDDVDEEPETHQHRSVTVKDEPDRTVTASRTAHEAAKRARSAAEGSAGQRGDPTGRSSGTAAGGGKVAGRSRRRSRGDARGRGDGGKGRGDGPEASGPAWRLLPGRGRKDS